MTSKSKMPMVKKGGKMVPAFAADGKGKMMAGGKATKGRAKMSSGGRTVSRTDASTAKSTPPKTGTSAQMQRMNNTVRSLAKDLNTAGIRSLFNQALKAQGASPAGRVSDKDVSVARKAKKAYGGKTKK